jgi:ubiquinone/menaquinone biosynthesis C-methylase UbiE
VSEDRAPSTEVERLTAEYEQRDRGAVAGSTYSFANPGYVFHVQDLEWELLRELRSQRVDLATMRVLEVGVGYGQWLQRFKEYGAFEAAGIDVLPWRIEAARERYPSLDLIAGDAADLPYDDGHFDVVLQITCLSSVLDEQVRRRIAAEMWRVTAPGGIVLSYDMRPTPFAIRALGRLYAMLRGRSAAATDSSTPTTPVAGRELEALFGRPVTSRRVVTLNFELASIAGRSRFAASLLRAVPWLRTHEMVVIRKET